MDIVDNITVISEDSEEDSQNEFSTLTNKDFAEDLFSQEDLTLV